MRSAFFAIGLLVISMSAAGQEVSASPNEVGFKLMLEGGQFTNAINIVLMMTVLSLAPSIVTMMTAFLRISIVLSTLKRAIGTSDPSPKLVAAMSMFLTMFVMYPVWTAIYTDSIQPYSEKKITQAEAMEKATAPVKEFMLKQTRDSSLILFMELAEMEPVESPEQLPMWLIVPGFILSELKTAFQMSFLIYLPFLLIDIVVATVLMAMGMMMLPPQSISLPFKLLLFIVVDGWEMVIRSLVRSFN